MPNYQNGKIYKITSGDLTYIGSTTQPTVAKRLAQHVGDFKKWKPGIGKCTSYALIESGDYTISLIESYPCNTKDELTARERFYIESMPCINKVRKLNQTEEDRIQSKKEWREANPTANADYYKDHQKEIRERKIKKYNETKDTIPQEQKDKIAAYQKEYREKNKERLAAYHKEYQKEYQEKKKSIV